MWCKFHKDQEVSTVFLLINNKYSNLVRSFDCFSLKYVCMQRLSKATSFDPDAILDRPILELVLVERLKVQKLLCLSPEVKHNHDNRSWISQFFRCAIRS